MMPSSMNLDTLANNTITDAMGRSMIRFPAAVPINLLPLMVRSPEISTEDLAILKEKIFTKDLLDDIVVDYSSLLATFRGKPGISAKDTYERYMLIPFSHFNLSIYLSIDHSIVSLSSTWHIFDNTSIANDLKLNTLCSSY